MTDQAQTYVTGQHPDMPPPITQVGIIGWLRANLFSSIPNSIATILGVIFLAWLIPPIISWAFIDAYWTGETRDACVDRDGACWVFIKVWFRQLMYGRYPPEEIWRINLSYVILVGTGVLLFIPGFKWKPWVGLFLLVGFPIIAFILYVGGSFGLPHIETPLRGGLFLTLVIGGVGIVASLPIGIVLALGRRSQMPVVRSICVAFIELWRGVPLITVLFMASVMFPLFLPEGMNFDKLIRALIGVMLFSAAYMAEVVRGGLQALPKGQYEAAEALGLNYWKMMGLIILPQALKMVIPGIVNTFIGLFKDTTLVLIIGLFDLLGIAKAAVTNGNWIGLSNEAYAFVGFTFFIFCFSMARYSIWLEAKLHTGHKR